jgi:hypothetical protein
MLNPSVKYSYLLGVTLILLSACYQKKAPKKHHIVTSQEDEFPDDTLVSGLNPDSITYVDTFKLIPTTTIFSGIQKNAKQKVVYSLPKLKSGDTLQDFEYIENCALTNVYASVGKMSSNQKLYKSSLLQNETLVAKIMTSDSISFSIKMTLDSLNQLTETLFSDNQMQNEWAYFEAIQWLENLYLTIEKPKNSRSQKKLEELIFLQLENGTEMLERLSAYQDYPPISIFAEYLIDILDCKYYTFDVTQLRNEVIDARNNIYILSDSASK